ncbi:MAG: helix-turn-helix domain-containing protein [Oscillospiraceae bacterium]|nr:helix-turn-helix domain-containing protein [Oscillospiraceae bacterium]
MNVAQRLIFLREKRGITTNKLANLAGISQSHLREIELGQRNPTVETLSFFCDALGVTLEEFFHENDDINPFLESAVKRLSDDQQAALADFINKIT